MQKLGCFVLKKFYFIYFLNVGGGIRWPVFFYEHVIQYKGVIAKWSRANVPSELWSVQMSAEACAFLRMVN